MSIRWIYVWCLVSIWHSSEVGCIECYDCNSAYDPRCGEPFDSYALGTVDCSRRPPPEHLDLEAKLCRKITQVVYGRRRVVRGCGYIPEDGAREGACARRGGTRDDVFVVQCACAGDLCNRAAPRAAARGVAPLLLLLLALVL